MKLELVAHPGRAPDAILVRGRTHRAGDILRTLPARLLGKTVEFATELSHRWGCFVYCTPEFRAWWTTREGEPPASQRIFLKVLRA